MHTVHSNYVVPIHSTNFWLFFELSKSGTTPPASCLCYDAANPTTYSNGKDLGHESETQPRVMGFAAVRYG